MGKVIVFGIDFPQVHFGEGDDIVPGIAGCIVGYVYDDLGHVPLQTYVHGGTCRDVIQLGRTAHPQVIIPAVGGEHPRKRRNGRVVLLQEGSQRGSGSDGYTIEGIGQHHHRIGRVRCYQGDFFFRSERPVVKIHLTAGKLSGGRHAIELKHHEILNLVIR